jgi:hypothetical protein
MSRQSCIHRSKTKPEKLVSTPLIEALVACDGLIYLSGGASERSFWVAFERDYALRLGKPVFSADPATLQIFPHTGKPLDLATFASYCYNDHGQIKDIAQFLKRERHFDLRLDSENLEAGVAWVDEIADTMKDRLDRGGYVIAFWSESAKHSDFVRKEVQRAEESGADVRDYVLFALLDRTPMPEFWTRFQEPGVQLFGDEERSATQRMDDLVVRLYWLIYRKAQARHLD